MKTAFLCIAVFAAAAAGTVFIDTNATVRATSRSKAEIATVQANTLTAFEFEPERVPEAYAELHRHYAKAFVEEEGFGMERMEPLIRFHAVSSWGFHSHRRKRIKVDLKKIELIGVVQHAQPRVYVSPYLASDRLWFEWISNEQSAATPGDQSRKKLLATHEEKPVMERVSATGKMVTRIAKAPKMNQFRNTPTRAPDEFETKALEQLKRGDHVAWQMDKDGVRMVGALRATKDCMACHEVKEGALLGALAYRLDPWRIFSKMYDRE
ncbi:MAG TPA: DUF3365 domain-containing protein [Planctomycetota bacterium]|nr:DUF3365 domain-containing protein [Planctomycetota bacterium]